jgi:hypothetical protein
LCRGTGQQKHYAALKVLKNTVASIIIKWKKFETTKTLGFAKMHLKDSQTMRNKMLWSDETKIELLGLNAKCHVWRKTGTIPSVKYGGGSIMMWGCFSAADTGRFSQD